MSAFSTLWLLNRPLYKGRVNFVFPSPIIISFFTFSCLYKTMERYLLEITTGSSSPSTTTRQSRSFHIVLRAFWAIFLLCDRKQNTTLSQLWLRPFSPVQRIIVERSQATTSRKWSAISMVHFSEVCCVWLRFTAAKVYWALIGLKWCDVRIARVQKHFDFKLRLR